FDDVERFLRSGGHGVEVAEALVNERLGECSVELAQQVCKVLVGVDEDNGFVVKTELLERDHLQDFFERAKSAGQRDVSVAELIQPSLARPHVVHRVNLDRKSTRLN